MKVTRKAGKVGTLRQTIKALDGAQGRVGWFPSAKYEKGQPVAGIAAVHEFGIPSKNIPERAFMRPTAIEHHNEWKETVGQLTKAAAQGHIKPDDIMEAVCLAAEGHVRGAIIKLSGPKLKDATIAARKRRLANGGKGAASTIEKPLVDSGIMLASLTSEID